MFSAYSGELASDVREGMLVKIRLEKNFYHIASHVILGKSTIDTWMKKMLKMEIQICMLNRYFRVEIGEVVTEVIVAVVVEAAVALVVEPPTFVPQHTADLVAKHQKRKK